VTNLGGILFDTATNSIVLGGTLVNAGTITHAGANNLRGSSATLTNQSGAVYDLTADGGFGTLAGVFAVNNAGTFRKSGGTGTSTVTGGATFTRAASLTNSGTLTVGSGSTVTTNGVSMSAAGAAVTINAGGTLAIAGTTNTFNNATAGVTTVNGTLSNSGNTS